ncbi:MAG: phosphodiester glycosidase family protein, partial [Clostridia bacterium]|nr:phosphodiester glycosidase family protein [Clostridia bacterium]
MQNKTKALSFVLCVCMLLGLVPFTAFGAGVDYDHNGSTSTDEYYNLISKQDWDNAPGIAESEIVLNNDAGNYRQVIHIMKADANNQQVQIIPTYSKMDTSVYQTGTMLDQANWIDENMNGSVVGTMNCCLSWYTGYPADRVGEPLGFMMLDGEIMFDPGNCGYEYGKVGFPTCVVINKDYDADGNPRPADIPKVEMPQILSSADLDGWEQTVIPISSGYIVKDGVNQNKSAHGTDPAPRSVVGITADGQVVMMENDGRQEPFSAGMNMYECAEVMIAAGCVWAANCDGGGSSTFVSRRPGEELKVNNSPSDGGLRPSTSGICFITTAISDGKFARANVSTEGEYFTPNSSVQFAAVGADIAGGAAQIPEDAKWTLSDSSFGTIDQDGLFVSTGKTGAVSAQIEYEGKVYGAYEINIVIPDAINFSQSVLTVPNGQQSSFTLSATYDVYEVISKASDFEVKLDNDNMGTLNGYVITATEDLTVTGGSITATLTHNSDVTATMQVVFGKASEVVWDFENGFGDGWYIEHLQQRKNGNHAKPGLNAYNNILESYPVTSATGMVHDGNGAGAVYSDTTYGTLNWLGTSMRWAGETVTFENAKSIGVWVYFPKDAVSVAIRFCITGTKDGEKISIDSYPITYGDSMYFEESGWRYCAVDVSGYDSITLDKNEAWDPAKPTAGGGSRIEISCQLNGGSSGEYNWQTTPGVAGMNTFFLDNLTVDYSEACDDRDAPIFGEVQYVEPISTEDKYLNNQRNSATVTNYNSIGFAVNVAENTKYVNATGFDSDSIKAYIDGNEVEYSFNGKAISVPATELKNGVHTVKFTACDMAGNYASVIRKINVQAENNDANIWLVPQTDATLVPTGSQYWVDVVAKNVEDVEKVTLTLDLNNVNYWLLDRMVALYGFTATYTTDIAKENIAYITIERTGDVEATGKNVLVSIPVQTWEFKEDKYPGYVPSVGGDNDLNGNGMYDPYECWNEFVGHNYDIIINPLAGLVEFADDTTEMFSGDKIQVDTERQIGCWWSISSDWKQEYFLQYDKSSWHLHSAGVAQDKAATCTEEGYIGRVFCIGCSCVTVEKKGHECDTHEGCGAVLDWGTIIPANGHNYIVNADGKLACEGCDKLFNGEYTDGKTYVDGVVVADGWFEDTYYFIDGVKVTGQLLIDGIMCTFDEDGVYQPNFAYTGFYNDGNGWMYFMSNFQQKGFVVIDGNTHYFDDKTGYAPIGSFTLAEDRVYKVEGEQGKVLGGWDTYMVDGVERRRYYYSLRYYKNQWLEVEGDTYYFDNEGYALIGKRAVAFSGEYLGGYEFAMDGKLITPITGPFVDYESGYKYFAENGEMACNELVKHGDDYYFARNNYLLITWGTYISEEQTNGLLPAGEYQFDADGKLIMQNGPVADPFNSAYLNFYKDGIRVYEEGLYEYEGDYYYVRSNGLLLTWGMYITKTNGLLPAGEYKFGEDGKLQMLNGPIVDAYNSAYLNFYKDGIRVYEEGLYEFEGDYYYVRSNGLLLTWGMNITKTNGLLSAGE